MSVSALWLHHGFNTGDHRCSGLSDYKIISENFVVCRVHKVLGILCILRILGLLGALVVASSRGY